MNPFKRRSKQLYATRPKWLSSLYAGLPPAFKTYDGDKVGAAQPFSQMTPMDQLLPMPLDQAWSEAVIAPFHDPHIAPGLPFTFESVNAKECQTDHDWCSTLLSWSGCPEGEDAAVLDLTAAVELGPYERLILCLTVPEASCFKVELDIDGERRSREKIHQGTGGRMEVPVPVKGHLLERVRLVFASRTALAQTVRLSWFGVQDQGRLNRNRSNRAGLGPDWQGLVKPVEEWGQIAFEAGLMFAPKDLAGLRRKKTLPGWDKNFDLLEQKAALFMARVPEDDLGMFLPSEDRQYLREREKGKTRFCFEGLVLGFVGLINQDKAMMGHALRFLMCMVHTEHWTQSAESRLLGSTWDRGCSMAEMTTTSVALLADWFAFALTDRARELIRQSVWDKGLAVIDRDMRKFEYLYHVHQGAVFCRARIMGGLYLGQSWFRMENYVEQAFMDMSLCLGNYMEKDGGSSEGVGHFCQVLQAALFAVTAYARSKGKSPKPYIRRLFSQCDNYVKVMSGSAPGTAVAAGDCGTRYFSGDGIAVLARYFPGSSYEKILMACIEADSLYGVAGSLSHSGGIMGFVHGPDKVAPSQPVVPVFQILKGSGHLASFRRKGGYRAYCHVIGSRSNPVHSHFDKGSFHLAVNDTPVLIDRGLVDDHDPRRWEMTRSCLHNVMTPVLADGSYPDQNPPNIPVIPSGRGDEKRLSARIDLTPVWLGQMKACSRRFESHDPRELVITDAGHLKEEGRVAFHLQSPFRFEVREKMVSVRFGEIILEIEAPWADTIRSRQESAGVDYQSVYHLMIHSDMVKKFALETKIRF